MAPRGGGGRGGGGGGRSGGGGVSVDCDGCNAPVNFSTYGIEDPSVATGLAFSVIALVGLLIVWVMSWKVKRVYTPRLGAIGRRFGLGKALILRILYQLLDIVNTGVSETVIPARASFAIIQVFITFFGVFSDVLIFYCATRFLWTRFMAQLRPHQQRFVNSFSIASLWLAFLLFCLAWASTGITIRSLVLLLRVAEPFSSSVSNSELEEYQVLPDAGAAVIIAMRGIEMLFSIAIFISPRRLVEAHRQTGTKSQIPTIFMYVIAPAMFVRSASSIGLLGADAATLLPLRWYYLVSTLLFDLVTVVIFAGLVWVGLQADWFVDVEFSPTGEKGIDGPAPQNKLVKGLSWAIAKGQRSQKPKTNGAAVQSAHATQSQQYTYQQAEQVPLNQQYQQQTYPPPNQQPYSPSQTFTTPPQGQTPVQNFSPHQPPPAQPGSPPPPGGYYVWVPSAGTPDQQQYQHQYPDHSPVQSSSGISQPTPVGPATATSASSPRPESNAVPLPVQGAVQTQSSQSETQTQSHTETQVYSTQTVQEVQGSSGSYVAYRPTNPPEPPR